MYSKLVRFNEVTEKRLSKIVQIIRSILPIIFPSTNTLNTNPRPQILYELKAIPS